MANGRVDSDDQIKIGRTRRGVSKIFQLRPGVEYRAARFYAGSW